MREKIFYFEIEHGSETDVFRCLFLDGAMGNILGLGRRIDHLS